jgi:non-specific serine/threonine protein kinase/serine/threonine-protein kinase
LLERIGQGGMGEVWLAEQHHPVRRRVALKLIKAGMNTREIVSRFESERQALALMDHPAIASVFDAGATPEGLPYFVMEYVAGVPITLYCDKHRLSIRERLQLFVQVCGGVQHAHQKAMIHRDLKPSNILTTQVDGEPVPKIIDFGIAKAISQNLTDETMLTVQGPVGTPEYMSPEQAAFRAEAVDTRTDVYSLGVVLYELLVGVLPLGITEGRDLAFHELFRRIREEDAPRPSSKIRTSAGSSIAARNRRTEPDELARKLKGDLDSIVLKALEKDPSRRYGSPSDLAADIERYLHNQPVLAVAPTLAYSARKFVRRHRIIVTASVAVAVATCALIASLVVGSIRVARERDRANREANAAERVSDFLVGAFKVSDPDQSRGNKITAREVLDRGARQIDADLASQPYLQARMMVTMSRVYEGLGLYDPARQLVEKAIPLQRRVLGPDHRETLVSQQLLAAILQKQAHFSDSEKLYRETIRKQERAFGTDDIDTLRSKIGLGTVLFEQGRYADAENFLTEVVRATDRVSGPRSPESLSALHTLAIVYDGLRNYEKEAALDEELYRRRLQQLGADHPDTVSSMQNLARAYFRLGRFAEAESLQREGLEIGRRVQGEDHPSILLALGNLADTLMAEGKLREAETLQREALAGRLRVLGPDHQETQYAIANLGNILLAQKRYPEAESLYRQALEGEIRILGEHHPEIAYAWYNIATVEAAQGKRTKALADLHRAIDHGYSDADEIGQDAGWNALRKDSGYQEALVRMKKS